MFNFISRPSWVNQLQQLPQLFPLLTQLFFNISQVSSTHIRFVQFLTSMLKLEFLIAVNNP